MDAVETARAHRDELTWGDGRFLQWAASRLAAPREASADSFVLHASLELLARAVLLELVPDELHERPGCGSPAWWTATRPPATRWAHRPGSPRPTRPGGRDLVAALAVSDLAEVDRQAAWLGRTSPRRTSVVSSAPRWPRPSVPPPMSRSGSTSSGGHGGSTGRCCGLSARAGEGARWRWTSTAWPRGPAPRGGAPGDPAAGAGRPRLHPAMVVHGAGAAAGLLPDVSPDAGAAARAVSRVAAWSMLQERDDHVPFGWTHTLTVPQAVLSIGLDPRTAVAVAGTEVIGFRASMGSRALDPAMPIPRRRRTRSTTSWPGRPCTTTPTW